jgi:hypothetical protein
MIITNNSTLNNRLNNNNDNSTLNNRLNNNYDYSTLNNRLNNNYDYSTLKNNSTLKNIRSNNNSRLINRSNNNSRLINRSNIISNNNNDNLILNNISNIRSNNNNDNSTLNNRSNIISNNNNDNSTINKRLNNNNDNSTINKRLNNNNDNSTLNNRSNNNNDNNDNSTLNNKNNKNNKNDYSILNRDDKSILNNINNINNELNNELTKISCSTIEYNCNNFDECNIKSKFYSKLLFSKKEINYISNFMCYDLKQYLKEDINFNTREGDIIGAGIYGIIYKFKLNNMNYCIKFEKNYDKENYDVYNNMINTRNNIHMYYYLNNISLFNLSIFNNKLNVNTNSNIFNKINLNEIDNNLDDIDIRITISQYGLECHKNIENMYNLINDTSLMHIFMLLEDITLYNTKNTNNEYIFYGDIKLANLIYYNINDQYIIIKLIDYEDYIISKNYFIDSLSISYTPIMFKYSLGILDDSLINNNISKKIFFLYDTICLFICIICILYYPLYNQLYNPLYKSLYIIFSKIFSDDIKYLYRITNNEKFGEYILDKNKIKYKILFHDNLKIKINYLFNYRYNFFKQNSKLSNSIYLKKILTYYIIYILYVININNEDDKFYFITINHRDELIFQEYNITNDKDIIYRYVYLYIDYKINNMKN